MKQIFLFGTTGNNVSIFQIPTSWPISEIKKVLEQVLVKFSECQRNGQLEFLYGVSEEELDRDYPIKSPFINICKDLIKEIGYPTSENDIMYAFKLQNYLTKNSRIAQTILKGIRGNLSVSESEFIENNDFQKIVKFLEALNAYVADI